MDPGLVVEACGHCNLRGCTWQSDHKYKACMHNKASLSDLMRPYLIIKDKKSAREMAHVEDEGGCGSPHVISVWEAKTRKQCG